MSRWLKTVGPLANKRAPTLQWQRDGKALSLSIAVLQKSLHPTKDKDEVPKTVVKEEHRQPIRRLGMRAQTVRRRLKTVGPLDASPAYSGVGVVPRHCT